MKKPILMGVIASLGLSGLFFGILTFSNSFEHAVDTFFDMWYWFLVLMIGFGIQVGLFSYVRTVAKIKTGKEAAEIAASGGITAGSMVACCAHHVVDILPLLGLSAATVFLVRYQIPFIILGIVSNLIGMTLMLNVIQKHNLYQERGVLSKILKFDMIVVRNICIAIGSIVVISAFMITLFK